MTTNAQPAAPARSGPPAGFASQYVVNAEAALVAPFKGVTTDGVVIPGLYPLQQTGVSTEPIVAAAAAYLASLTPYQRAKTAFPLEAREWRTWSNIHPPLMRHGLSVFEMLPAQRDQAYGLLEASLSAAGYQLARDIMRLNWTVAEMTGKFDEYGEGQYWFSIMGTPSATEPWGWQVDGHHCIINYFVLGDQVTMTPAFMGSEPCHAEAGKYAGVRVFLPEQETGLALMQSLDPAQQAKAVIGETLPGDVITSAFKDNYELHLEGISYGSLSAPQQQHLLTVLETYVGRLPAGHAAVRMAEVRAHLADTHFGWIGACDNEAVFYYRVHSPVILCEFDHQRGVAFRDKLTPYRDHIHSIVRTPNGGDYGRDLLRQHYLQNQH